MLLGLFSGDDDDAKKPANQTTQPTPEPAGGTAGQSGAGTLTARDTSLLPAPAGGLAEFETEAATGQGVTVQSVVKDEGFWVGSSEQDRVYVEYGEDEAQGFEPKVGDKVDLTGEMRPAPANPAQTLNLPDEDAQLVSEQGRLRQRRQRPGPVSARQ